MFEQFNRANSPSMGVSTERQLQDVWNKLRAIEAQNARRTIAAGYGIVVSGSGDNIAISIGTPRMSVSLDCESQTGTVTLDW